MFPVVFALNIIRRFVIQVGEKYSQIWGIEGHQVVL